MNNVINKKQILIEVSLLESGKIYILAQTINKNGSGCRFFLKSITGDTESKELMLEEIGKSLETLPLMIYNALDVESL